VEGIGDECVEGVGEMGQAEGRGKGMEGRRHLLRIMEANLPDGHTAILFEVRPGRIDDRDVVALIAYQKPPGYQHSLIPCISHASCFLPRKGVPSVPERM